MDNKKTIQVDRSEGMWLLQVTHTGTSVGLALTRIFLSWLGRKVELGDVGPALACLVFLVNAIDNISQIQIELWNQIKIKFDIEIVTGSDCFTPTSLTAW